MLLSDDINTFPFNNQLIRITWNDVQITVLFVTIGLLRRSAHPFGIIPLNLAES